MFTTNDGVIEAVDEDEAEVDFLGESTSGNLRLVQRVKSEGIVNVLGLEQLDDIVTIPYNTLKQSQQAIAGAYARSQGLSSVPQGLGKSCYLLQSDSQPALHSSYRL